MLSLPKGEHWVRRVEAECLICRSVDEEVLDRVRGYHETEAYKKAYRKHTVWVEPLFARSAKTGTACDAFVCDGSGASIVKRSCEQQAKSEETSLTTRLGTASFPSGSRFCLLFGYFWAVDSSFPEVCVYVR